MNTGKTREQRGRRARWGPLTAQIFPSWPWFAGRLAGLYLSLDEVFEGQ